jgi:hypothetical protein
VPAIGHEPTSRGAATAPESSHNPKLNLTAIEAKPFPLASDFARAKQSYAAIGFEIPWSSEDLA